MAQEAVVLNMHSSEWSAVNSISIYFLYMLWIHLHVHVDTIARTQTITCYNVHCFTKLEICC